MTVAALYVFVDGPYASYADVPDVELWGVERDARKYRGPFPVVAHPPCRTWSVMSNCRPEIKRGDDDGMFKHALRCVNKFGGVLEHPAFTHAWAAFDLPKPPREGWLLLNGLWVCTVDQRFYGHVANKPTWLLYNGPAPPELKWGRAPKSEKSIGRDLGGGGRRRQSRRVRSMTPPAFRNVLLSLARAAGTC